MFSFCRPSLVLALNILTWSYLQPLQCVLGKTWDSQKFRAVAEAWELSFSSTVSSHHHKQAVPLATTAHSYCCSIYWLSHRENLKRWHCAWLGSVHIFFCTVSKQMKISLSQVVPKSFPEAPGASFSASSQWSSCRADHVNHIIINHPLQWSLDLHSTLMWGLSFFPLCCIQSSPKETSKHLNLAMSSEVESTTGVWIKASVWNKELTQSVLCLTIAEQG